MNLIAVRNIKILKWFNFFLDFRPYAVIAIIYFSKVTGSFALGLLVFSVATIASSVFELPTGIISDYVGRRKTLIYGSIATVLSLVFYALGSTFWVLAIGSVFAGLSSAFYSGNNEALLYDSLDGDEQAFSEHLGKTSSMFQVGLAISALLGGFIASVSLPLVMWVSVIPQVICLILSFYFVEPKVHKKDISTNIFSHLKESLSEFSKNSKLRTISLASAISYGVGETMYQFAPVFIASLWPTWAIGIARSLNNFLAATSLWFGGTIVKKLGALKSLIFGNVSNIVFGLVSFGFPTLASPLLLSISSLSYGLTAISEKTLLQKEFTDHQRATMGSLNSFFGSIFFSIFAYGFGLFADKMGARESLIVAEVVMIFVVILYGRIFKGEKNLIS